MATPNTEIVSCAGQRLTSSAQLDLLRTTTKGDRMSLEVRGDGKLLEFTVSDGNLGVQTEDRIVPKTQKPVDNPEPNVNAKP